MKKDLVSIADLTASGILDLLSTAAQLKKKPVPQPLPLAGKTISLIFQKPSTRTSISFAAGIHQLGGFPLILQADDLQWQRGESPSDTARVMSRYVDAVVIRAIRHKDVEDIAHNASLPVINGLTDQEHPCQVLADLLTLWERQNGDLASLRRLKLVFLGDANNVANSWLLAAALLGMHFVLACPERYGPKPDRLAQAQGLAARSGAQLVIVSDPLSAVQEADALYTDVWVSMGQEKELEERRRVFRPYQVNAMLLRQAKPGAMVMHCLPAKRGEEITDDVIDGPQSIVFDQAENRLHIQKAILIKLLASPHPPLSPPEGGRGMG